MSIIRILHRSVICSCASIVLGCGGSGPVFDRDGGGANVDAAVDASVDAADVGTDTGDAAIDDCTPGCHGSTLVTCEPEPTESDCELAIGGFCNPESVACEAVQGNTYAVASSEDATIAPGEPHELTVVFLNRLLGTTRAEPIAVYRGIDREGWSVEDSMPEDLFESTTGERSERTITVTPPAAAMPGDEVELRVVFSVLHRLESFAQVVTQRLVVGEIPEVLPVRGPVADGDVLEVRRGSSIEVPFVWFRLDGSERENFTVQHVVRAPGGGAVSSWIPNDGEPGLVTDNNVVNDATSFELQFRSLLDLDTLPTAENVELELHYTFSRDMSDGVPVDPAPEWNLVIPVRVLP